MSVTQDSERAFDRTVAAAARPVHIVTAYGGHRRGGCVVGFATQTSIDPVRFLACLSVQNHTYRVAQHSRRLAVHAVDIGHLNLARLFAEATGDDADKFSRCAWHPDPEGLPILEDAAAWFSGPIVQRVPLGDHVGHLLEPDSGGVTATVGALVTQTDLDTVQPGHPA